MKSLVLVDETRLLAGSTGRIGLLNAGLSTLHYASWGAGSAQVSSSHLFLLLQESHWLVQWVCLTEEPVDSLGSLACVQQQVLPGRLGLRSKALARRQLWRAH